MTRKGSNLTIFNFQFSIFNSSATALVVLFTLSSAAAAELRLRSEPIRCTETLVSLGDVADVVAGSNTEAERLRNTVLFTAPLPGEQRTVEVLELRNLLSRIGVSSLHHQLTGAKRIVLLGGESVVAEVPRAVRGTAGAPAKGSEGVAVKKVTEKPMFQVVLLRRSLPKGYVIGRSDVMLAPVDNVRDENFFIDLDEVVGLETTAALRERSILAPGMIKRPTWVFKGDIVTVHSMNNGIQVRTDGTALSDGVQGDTVSIATIDPNANVRNKRSQKDRATFLARVSAPKTVEVHASGIIVGGEELGRAQK